jgi:mannitol-1-phosphate/altronate dehydrogenase
MLHTFFFLLSFLMDYRTVADAIQNSSLDGFG